MAGVDTTEAVAIAGIMAAAVTVLAVVTMVWDAVLVLAITASATVHKEEVCSVQVASSAVNVVMTALMGVGITSGISPATTVTDSANILPIRLAVTDNSNPAPR